jgi:hypothetical protein
METSKEIRPEGLTPAGGVRAVAYFRDENGNPTEQSKAYFMEILEYDKQDNVLQRTYATTSLGAGRQYSDWALEEQGPGGGAEVEVAAPGPA